MFVKKESSTSARKMFLKIFLKNKYKIIVILDSFKLPSTAKKTVKFKMKKSDIQIL